MERPLYVYIFAITIKIILSRIFIIVAK